ncbi:MAG: hypothetical protein VXZ96_06655 [Myxococcota bacterium]|nr:hypothetical protein [Myxococcota bacterium]
MRQADNQINQEWGFSVQGNFVRAADGSKIANNEGQPWPKTMSQKQLWDEELNAVDETQK